MPYIMITEDGETYQAATVEDGDKDGCDAGILDVIDTDTMKKYYEGEWHDLQTWGKW